MFTYKKENKKDEGRATTTRDDRISSIQIRQGENGKKRNRKRMNQRKMEKKKVSGPSQIKRQSHGLETGSPCSASSRAGKRKIKKTG